MKSLFKFKNPTLWTTAVSMALGVIAAIFWFLQEFNAQTVVLPSGVKSSNHDHITAAPVDAPFVSGVDELKTSVFEHAPITLLFAAIVWAVCIGLFVAAHQLHRLDNVKMKLSVDLSILGGLVILGVGVLGTWLFVNGQPSAYVESYFRSLAVVGSLVVGFLAAAIFAEDPESTNSSPNNSSSSSNRSSGNGSGGSY